MAVARAEQREMSGVETEISDGHRRARALTLRKEPPRLAVARAEQREMSGEETEISDGHRRARALTLQKEDRVWLLQERNSVSCSV